VFSPWLRVFVVAVTGLTDGAAAAGGADAGAGDGRGVGRTCTGLGFGLSFGAVTTTSGSWVCAVAPADKPIVAAIAEPQSALPRRARKVSTDIKRHS
jgi:hypothetical protein